MLNYKPLFLESSGIPVTKVNTKMNLPSEKSVNISEKDVIFAMGIRFWSNLVLTDDISSVQKCVEILDNLKMISENKEAFNLIFLSEGVEEKNDKNQTVNRNHETQHQPTRPFLLIKQMPVQDEYHLKFDDTNKDIPCTQKSTESAVLDDILTDPFPEDKTNETKEAKKDERYKCAFCKFQHNHFRNLRQHMMNVVKHLVRNTLTYIMLRRRTGRSILFAKFVHTAQCQKQRFSNIDLLICRQTFRVNSSINYSTHHLT